MHRARRDRAAGPGQGRAEGGCPTVGCGDRRSRSPRRSRSASSRRPVVGHASAGPRCAGEATHDSALKSWRAIAQRLAGPRLRAFDSVLARRRPGRAPRGFRGRREGNAAIRPERSTHAHTAAPCASSSPPAEKEQCSVKAARQLAYTPSGHHPRTGGRDRAPAVLDGRTHVAFWISAERVELHARLEIRRPKLGPFPLTRSLRDRQEPANLDFRARQQRRSR